MHENQYAASENLTSALSNASIGPLIFDTCYMERLPLIIIDLRLMIISSLPTLR